MEILHVRVPGVRRAGVGALYLYAEEAFGQAKEPVEDLGQRKVGAQLVVGVVKARFAQALGPEAGIPVQEGFFLAVFAGEGLHLGKVGAHGAVGGGL